MAFNSAICGFFRRTGVSGAPVRVSGMGGEDSVGFVMDCPASALGIVVVGMVGIGNAGGDSVASSAGPP